jgi:hypothetical protein
MLLATFVLERPALSWQDLWSAPDRVGALEGWVQGVGGLAAVALAIWLLAYLIRGPGTGGRIPWPRWQALTFRILLICVVVGYALWAILAAPGLERLTAKLQSQKLTDPSLGIPVRLSLVVGGGSAILAVLLPFLVDLFRLRGRRIWAIARLSFKEALRRRILWVFFGIMLVIFLFAGWFLDPKPESQVRNYVKVVYTAMSYLALLVAVLLAAFSIPADIRSQAIHTIVTKPVERFEIVLGRFLGYGLLMSLALGVMSGISLVYVLREIHPDAKAESMRAREPLFGKLRFNKLIHKENTSFQGTDVGREWSYRKYIAGGAQSSERAIFEYDDLPAELARRPGGKVPCEYSFDIFRTLKGVEGAGIICSFTFHTRRWDPQRYNQYQQARTQQLSQPNANPDQVATALAEEYGIYEMPSKEVVDYHTQGLEVPAALFLKAEEATFLRADGKRVIASVADRKGEVSFPVADSVHVLVDGSEAKLADIKAGSRIVLTTPADGGAINRVETVNRTGDEPAPALRVVVHCESGGQYVGMAKYDFYVLDADGSFAWNFYKGAAGLWLRVLLVIGLAVTWSTYLSGVISLVVTFAIYGVGVFREFLLRLATGAEVGGGPMEAFYRLTNKQGIVTPLETTAAARLALGTDAVYRWIFRRIFDLIPDVDRFDWTVYVKEGFNINIVNLVLPSTLMLVGYLLPCGVLAYYLMKSREVAS